MSSIWGPRAWTGSKLISVFLFDQSFLKGGGGGWPYFLFKEGRFPRGFLGNYFPFLQSGLIGQID